ncbi:MAG: hypothetical protein RIT43_1068 [Bacteroidota bacterium]|jgi:hypothetical protein
MKNKKTLYHFILDSSGSMKADRHNTVNMFNRQVATVRSLAIDYPQQIFLTGLTVFNDRIDHILLETPVNLLRELSYDRYMPDGFTALYDAIGETTQRIKERFGLQIDAGEMSVVVIILTDGHENASKRFDVHAIGKMIRELEAKENWTFTILGADFDITTVSVDLNFRTQSSFNYSKQDFKYMAEDIEDSMRNYASLKSSGESTKDYFKKK